MSDKDSFKLKIREEPCKEKYLEVHFNFLLVNVNMDTKVREGSRV